MPPLQTDIICQAVSVNTASILTQNVSAIGMMETKVQHDSDLLTNHGLS